MGEMSRCASCYAIIELRNSDSEESKQDRADDIGTPDVDMLPRTGVVVSLAGCALKC